MIEKQRFGCQSSIEYLISPISILGNSDGKLLYYADHLKMSLLILFPRGIRGMTWWLLLAIIWCCSNIWLPICNLIGDIVYLLNHNYAWDCHLWRFWKKNGLAREEFVFQIMDLLYACIFCMSFYFETWKEKEF